MTQRERVYKVLNREQADRLPRSLGGWPGVGMYRKDELDRVEEAYPQDIKRVAPVFGKSPYEQGIKNVIGWSIDEYGNKVYCAENGVSGEVKEPVISSWDKLDSYKLPWPFVKEADYSVVDRDCERTRQFCYIPSQARPFEQLQMLRGPENLFMDLGEGEGKLDKLIEMVHEYNICLVTRASATGADAVSFMDDWGTQISMLVSPGLWRGKFKPLYQEYIKIIHAAGKKVFFHSDGFIEPIYPELADIGIDAINSQLFCMDVEKLVAKYGGKITFWGELDRQKTLPYGSVQDVYAAVDRLRNAIVGKHGILTGMIAHLVWGNDTPEVNVAAAFDRWDYWAVRGGLLNK